MIGPYAGAAALVLIAALVVILVLRGRGARHDVFTGEVDREP